MKYRNIREMPFVPVGTEWQLNEYGLNPNFFMTMYNNRIQFSQSEMDELVKQGWMERVEERRKPRAGEVWQYKKYPPFVICETKFCHSAKHGHGIDGKSSYLVETLDVKFLAPSLEEYFREKHDEP